MQQDPESETPVNPYAAPASIPTALNARTLEPLRGMRAAAAAAAIGAVAPAALMLAFTVCRWAVQGSSAFDRQFDLLRLKRDLLGPIIGCSCVFACAGWATFAPAGVFRFARSLAIVFTSSLPVWFVLSSMQLTPRRIGYVRDPAIYPSEFLVIVAPPILAAGIVTLVRMKTARA